MLLRSLIPVVAFVLIGMAAVETIRAEDDVSESWQRAEARGKLNREALRRVDRVLQLWLDKINPETGLPPQRYERNSVWTVANAAADLYSSLVLRRRLRQPGSDGRHAQEGARDLERKHAERIGHLPDDLDIHTLEFVHPEASLARSQYGASEWCRDGLLRITESPRPGQRPWFGRMAELSDEIMARADVETRFGGPCRARSRYVGRCCRRSRGCTPSRARRSIASGPSGSEIIICLKIRPTSLPNFRLRDHGGEILSGLAEMYAMTHRADLAKAAAYEKPLREMLDRVMEIGQDAGRDVCQYHRSAQRQGR